MTFFRKTDHTPTDDLETLIASTQNFISRTDNSLNASLETTEHNKLILTIDDIKVFVECEEDLFILNEVVNENVYGLFSKDDFVLFDIGLNIGIASLFFNKMTNIKKIYAFEPVLDTYEKCQLNLSLNEDTSKIKTFNFGLGDKDETKVFNFSSSYKGSVGTLDLSNYKKENSGYLKEIEVQIRDASKVLSEIIKDNPNQKFIIKMDCEGGEYEIIPNLKTNGVLDMVDLIMLEWHKTDFFKLMDNFENFHCFYNKNSSETGMMYAFRK
jgi:FkbM family methyltransferase